jgi:hypothetical protein
VNLGGVFLVGLGILVGCQIFGGQALERLKIVG